MTRMNLDHGSLQVQPALAWTVPLHRIWKRRVLALLLPFLTAAPLAKADDKISFDKKGRIAVYGGNCQVKRTDTEFLLDIDPNPPGTAGPTKVRTRLILNPFTAKRLLVALQTTMQRHEATFGTVKVPAVKPLKEEAALDPSLMVVYSNFCRISSTAEEVFLDFGVNENPFAEGPTVVTVDRVVIMTHVRAKMLQAVLAKAVSAYEEEVGVIELDVRKRVKQQSKP
jgi:hypothetical protein